MTPNSKLREEFIDNFIEQNFPPGIYNKVLALWAFKLGMEKAAEIADTYDYEGCRECNTAYETASGIGDTIRTTAKEI